MKRVKAVYVKRGTNPFLVGAERMGKVMAVRV
jgi:hypothetical protein